MEVMRKVDLHLGEAEAAGLEDEAKAEGQACHWQEGSGRTESIWEDA